jgi:DNA-binding beta-propeller fold protein YncE
VTSAASTTAQLGHVTMAGRSYTVERDFGRPPSDMAPARISQVAVDSLGSLHVLRRGEPPVLVFDPDGAFVHSYGQGEIFDSHGISIDRWDRIWITDRDAHQIVVFNLKGEPLLRIGERHAPGWMTPFNHPTRAAVAPDGEIYVADGYGNAQIHRFSPGGDWRASFGEIGQRPGQFMTPHSIIVDRQNRLLVCDRENDRVQVFDRDGRWLSEWRGLCRPMDLCERDDGIILVTDQVPSVNAFAPDGKRVGRGRPSLNGAHGVALGGAGEIYLAEIDPSFVTKLTPC